MFSVVLNELGDFPMMRRMLLGIRDRAEDDFWAPLDAGGPHAG
jgi:hypothetical protein